MKKISKYLLIEIALVLIFLIIFPTLVIKERVGVNHEGGNPILPLQSGKSYTQTIRNPTKSLNSISLQLKNPQIKDNSLIYIEILDEQGEIQKDFSIYGDNIGDPSWIKLDFSPIENTNLILKVSGQSKFDNSLYLFADQNNYFDIKTTYALPSFKSRLLLNIDYQINQFYKRNLFFNLSYLAVIAFLNLYLIKLIKENN